MPSKKAEQTAKEKKDAEAKKAEEKAAKEAAQKEAREAKEKERAAARQELIDDGALIVDGDVEYHRVEAKEDKERVLDERAVNVLDKLEKSKTPLLGKDLQEEFGGGWPLYIPMFSMLKAQSLVVEYRRRTGERGGGGVAYLHTKHL